MSARFVMSEQVLPHTRISRHVVDNLRVLRCQNDTSSFPRPQPGGGITSLHLFLGLACRQYAEPSHGTYQC